VPVGRDRVARSSQLGRGVRLALRTSEPGVSHGRLALSVPVLGAVASLPPPGRSRGPHECTELGAPNPNMSDHR